jgi:GWxTD domain-containing protein
MNELNHKFILILHLIGLMVIIAHSSVQAEIVRGLELPLQSEGNLLFYADIYQFESADEQLRVEICYSIDLSQLQIENQTRSEYNFTLDLKFLNKEGKVIKDISEKKTISEADFVSYKNSSFLDLKKLYFIPDTVRFVLTLSDSFGGKFGVIDTIIELQPFLDDLSVSDPIFISYISKASDENNVFTRQSVLMIPNPARSFHSSSENGYFFIYFDINNLDYDPDLPSLYRMECSIDDLTGKSVNKIEHSQLKKVGANTSRLEKISIDQLKTGMYNLNIQLADLANDKTASTHRYFKVISQENNTPLVMPMEEEDIEKYYDQIKYIATYRELEIYQQLDNKGKQEFLLQFWKSKDPTPDTPENEFMLQHFQKMDYCEKHFQNGINSDRGRVYIQYGPPVDLERNVSTIGYSKPVEIWTYSLDGRVEFVFVDRVNDDNYVLMHSTHPNEYYNPGWMQDFQ